MCCCILVQFTSIRIINCPGGRVVTKPEISVNVSKQICNLKLDQHDQRWQKYKYIHLAYKYLWISKSKQRKKKVWLEFLHMCSMSIPRYGAMTWPGCIPSNCSLPKAVTMISNNNGRLKTSIHPVTFRGKKIENHMELQLYQRQHQPGPDLDRWPALVKKRLQGLNFVRYLRSSRKYWVSLCSRSPPPP